MSEVPLSDIEAINRQLGRLPRGVVKVAHRCDCGQPSVVMTAPRLEDGTPFPTTYYLTCSTLASRIGTLEADGVMRDLEARLAEDAGLRDAYRLAHESYLRDRYELEDVPEIHGISAGGMPDRVKCLHVLVAHSLAKGPGVNPLGDLVLEMLGSWGSTPCGEGVDS